MAVAAFKVPSAQQNKALDALIREEVHGGPQFSKAFGVYRDEINVWYEAHPKRTAISPDLLLSTCFGTNRHLAYLKRATTSGVNWTIKGQYAESRHPIPCL